MPDDVTTGGETAPPAETTVPAEQAPETQSLIAEATPQQQAPAVSEPWINQDGTFKEKWYERFPPEMQPRLARIKNAEDLAKAYSHAQSRFGEKHFVFPTEKSTPEEIAEFRKQVGVPERPDDYQIKPENFPEENWNEELTKPFREIAHKHHVSQAAFKEIVAAYAKMEEFKAQNAIQYQQADIIKRRTEGTATLKNLWRDQYGGNIQRVAQINNNIMHVDENDKGWESPGMVAGIMRLIGKLSEDSLVGSSNGSNGGGFTLTGEAAALDIQTNEDNPLYKPYHDRFHPQHQEAVTMLRHHRQKSSKK